MFGGGRSLTFSEFTGKSWGIIHKDSVNKENEQKELNVQIKFLHLHFGGFSPFTIQEELS